MTNGKFKLHMHFRLTPRSMTLEWMTLNCDKFEISRRFWRQLHLVELSAFLVHSSRTWLWSPTKLSRFHCLRWLLLGVPALWVYWVYILHSEYSGRKWRFSTSIRENISQTVSNTITIRVRRAYTSILTCVYIINSAYKWRLSAMLCKVVLIEWSTGTQ